jgi:hypothetical protein
LVNEARRSLHHHIAQLHVAKLRKRHHQ